MTHEEMRKRKEEQRKEQAEAFVKSYFDRSNRTSYQPPNDPYKMDPIINFLLLGVYF